MPELTVEEVERINEEAIRRIKGRWDSEHNRQVMRLCIGYVEARLDTLWYQIDRSKTSVERERWQAKIDELESLLTKLKGEVKE